MKMSLLVLLVNMAMLSTSTAMDGQQFVFSASQPRESAVEKRYKPTWKSLDTRPLPPWYDQAKFGIFIHWGVFSVPSFRTEWFWNQWKSGSPAFVEFMEKNYPPNFTYADFAKEFTAEFYDPDQWADVLQASGANYVVLTSKHHEGYCNWPTNVSFNWNAMDVGPKRDLVGDLAKSVRNRTHLHFGLYHSLYEWFHPLYLKDKENKFTTRYFPASKTIPELYELVNTYKPDVVWSDGPHGPANYWGSQEFLAWLYNDSPVKDTVVVNDRWCDTCKCKHGDFKTCTDKFSPGKLQKFKWEDCMSIDTGSWGYRRDAKLSDYLTPDQLVATLVETVSCGGNLLMNIGPTHDGRIVPAFEERLRQMGSWLQVNGEAIYASQPWSHQNDTVTKHVWYTRQIVSSGPVVYAIALFWPTNNSLSLGAPTTTTNTQVTMVGYHGSLQWQAGVKGGIVITIPQMDINTMPCQWAWAFKLENLAN